MNRCAWALRHGTPVRPLDTATMLMVILTDAGGIVINLQIGDPSMWHPHR
jgi:hypothetical protein